MIKVLGYVIRKKHVGEETDEMSYEVCQGMGSEWRVPIEVFFL